mmetsp:Transcript_98659/g.175679  ORF Transcript_98659/g.175679 Transcript_98659/m.175679 type:complete len:135 (-) Transcript_98659:32-436(-)|eukprot:CAMPEP_0197647896 /NCGR_PEP_ID=MMETSP1338-20131121/26821_1 /TAXON_ID=43686 ORGANISM="Pelagodinium beii, Strain RCC1491" /NCGR_SAMPLE_ID=MMETSP1338 /ASSEMBLY_ACC=CAM_ASM_000754 /LENGTH=134 /DNA_ID=CAMNT_0043221787 /DNA_START=69 /DNA_END=473 /DNA_ORIENTATION=+
MSSGVVLEDGILEKFNEMKLKHTKRFMVFKIDSGKIVLETEAESDKTYEDFVNALPTSEPRYAVVDFKFETDDGRPQDKLVFIAWSPDDCGVKPKMLYSSSKDAIAKKLTGIAKSLQINDSGDLAHEEILKSVK